MIKEDQRISKPEVDRFTTLNHPVRHKLSRKGRLVCALYGLTEEIAVVEGKG